LPGSNIACAAFRRNNPQFLKATFSNPKTAEWQRYRQNQKLRFFLRLKKSGKIEQVFANKTIPK
jgi:hypothetical protein